MRVFISVIFVVICVLISCSEEEERIITDEQLPVEAVPYQGCAGTYYQPWQSSSYVLPYPVGETYRVHLSHCSGSYHSEGKPDAFAVDFEMPIGTLITASRMGIVEYVEERGVDGEWLNNLVVVRHNDNTYAQYMHLTRYGAIAEVGDLLQKGDSIGYSGATGLAGYPHLHFVITDEGYEYPYRSIPHNFSNTEANPRGPVAYKPYTALPY